MSDKIDEDMQDKMKNDVLTIYGEKCIKYTINLPVWMYELLQKRSKILSTDVSKLIRFIIEKFADEPFEIDIKRMSLDTLKKELEEKNKHRSEANEFRKDLKEMKETINSLVTFVRQKQLKEMHTELHPREKK
ncbi:MAG: hypothetical protein WC732_01900 [Candidatus Omnitrophota bacterium]